jgi:hypothetical protein
MCMGLAVRICVSLKLKQMEKIKARSQLKQMRGHFIGQRYGQVLLRGTLVFVDGYSHRQTQRPFHQEGKSWSASFPTWNGLFLHGERDISSLRKTSGCQAKRKAADLD